MRKPRSRRSLNKSPTAEKNMEPTTEILEADATLKGIVRRLADAYHPQRIYLFGSKARGTAGPQSDYDLLVVVSDDAPPEAWLTKASHDLEAARRLMTGDIPLPSQAAFHAQQAVERAQKAFLTWHKQPFTKTHDLGALGGTCVVIDATLAAVASAVAKTSGYAVETRYPGPWSKPTLAEAEEPIRLAREMYDEVLARLPGEVKPK
jgi:HEPN domain-containing protein